VDFLPHPSSCGISTCVWLVIRLWWLVLSQMERNKSQLKHKRLNQWLLLHHRWLPLCQLAAPVATSPPSEGSSSASSDDSASPVNHSAMLWCWFRSTWLRPIRKVQKYVVKAKQPSSDACFFVMCFSYWMFF
jgi:hypothetical protein